MKSLAIATALLALASGAGAQERQIRDARLPYRVERHLLDVVRDPATRTFPAGGFVAAGDTIAGDVVVTSDTLDLAGRVLGELVVLGGVVRLEDGARVLGDVTLVDGRVEGDAARAFAGTMVAYGTGSGRWEPADTAWPPRDRGWRDGRPRNGPWHDEWGFDGRWGRADLDVGLAGSYNRVEGLPVRVGPVVRTAGPNPTRLRGALIWRTESGGAGPDDLGWDASLEQYLGGRGEWRVGAGVQSLVVPVDAGGVTDLETSLSTLLAHRDYRDHFEREGWRAFLAWSPRAVPLDVTLTYRDEDQRSAPARSPWTLRDNDTPWRLQPLVGVGALRSVSGEATWDSRRLDRGRHGFLDLEPGRLWYDGADDPGWYVHAVATRGVDGDLALPARTIGPDGPTFAPTPLPVDFTSAELDVRRYEQVGWDSQLALRGYVAGAVGSTPLPPQYQHALGGLGTLPGQPLFDLSCGARSMAVTTGSGDAAASYLGGYGCDRVALFQAEYRGGVHLDLFDWGGWDDSDGWDDGWDDSDDSDGWRSDEPSRASRRHDRDWDGDVRFGWSAFFDAGRGWALDPSGNGTATSAPALYDAGLGVLIGGVGLYWAHPVGNGGGSSTFFIRLGRRF